MGRLWVVRFDDMDPAATAAWIQFTHEGYCRAMPEDFGRTIVGFRGDEPLIIAPRQYENIDRVNLGRFQRSFRHGLQTILDAPSLAGPCWRRRGDATCSA